MSCLSSSPPLLLSSSPPPLHHLNLPVLNALTCTGQPSSTPSIYHCLAWGHNLDGALGLGTTDAAYKPQPIIALQGLVVSNFACGGGSEEQHSAAVTSSGALYTWGSGRSGQLGHGDLENLVHTHTHTYTYTHTHTHTHTRTNTRTGAAAGGKLTLSASAVGGAGGMRVGTHGGCDEYGRSAWMGVGALWSAWQWNYSQLSRACPRGWSRGCVSISRGMRLCTYGGGVGYRTALHVGLGREWAARAWRRQHLPGAHPGRPSTERVRLSRVLRPSPHCCCLRSRQASVFVGLGPVRAARARRLGPLRCQQARHLRRQQASSAPPYS